MDSNECNLCYRQMPKSNNEKLEQFYCKILNVRSICNDCLTNIEKSRKEFMTRKNVNEEVKINVNTS